MCPDCAFEEVRANYIRRKAEFANIPDIRFARAEFKTVNPAIKPAELPPVETPRNPEIPWYWNVAQAILRPARAVMALF